MIFYFCEKIMLAKEIAERDESSLNSEREDIYKYTYHLNRKHRNIKTNICKSYKYLVRPVNRIRDSSRAVEYAATAQPKQLSNTIQCDDDNCIGNKQ